MAKSAQRRHHKHERVRHAIQAHAGGGRLHSNGSGLRLPRYDASGIPGYPRIIYPRGWIFKRVAPDNAALWIGGVGLVVIVVCLALALLRGG